MKRSLLLPLLIVSLTFSFAQNRPNILILIADDMGTDAFSAYNLGSDLPHTPHLDSLVSAGLLFENAWAYPSCAPSRATLLTGRYGNKTGVMRSGPSLPNAETTLFEQVKSVTADAYTVGSFGKWHLGGVNHPTINGADWFEGNRGSGIADYYEWERITNGQTDTAETYITTFLTDQAIDWIDTQSQPWLCWMAYNAPHSPYHLPPDSLYTRTDTASIFDKYLCMIESVDHEVGRLLASLSQTERDSTLVLFVGDNGTPNNVLQAFPNRHGKGSVYEGGIRVPMFISGYGVPRSDEREEALVSFTDLFATLTELLGEDLTGGIDNSFSFRELLSDPSAPTRPYNYSEVEEDGAVAHAIRDERYKLIIQADDTEEFYDLRVDSLEMTDLIPIGLTPTQQAIYTELKAEADSVFLSWSCNDDIQNGDEEDIDCGGSSCTDCEAVSVREEVSTALTVFPNPLREEAVLHLVGGIPGQINVYNLQGKLQIQQQKNASETASLGLQSLASGSYILEVVSPNGLFRQIILKP